MGLGKKVLLIGPRIRKCTAGVAGGEGAQLDVRTNSMLVLGFPHVPASSGSGQGHVPPDQFRGPQMQGCKEAIGMKEARACLEIWVLLLKKHTGLSVQSLEDWPVNQ